MSHSGVAHYWISEQGDGTFKINRGKEELPESFDCDVAAEKQIGVLIRKFGGERSYSYERLRPWRGTCPNCGADSLILARTGGRVIQQCGRPEYMCTYERDVGVDRVSR